MTGYPDGPAMRSGASVGDSYTGLTMFLAIVLACYRKKCTGKGSRLDVSMLDTMFATVEDAVLAYSLTGKPISRTGNAKPREIVPYDVYECADGPVAVGITEDSMWPDFCKAVGEPELKDNKLYATNSLRCENFSSFTEHMAAVMKDKKMDDVVAEFMKYNVPVSKLQLPLEALNSKHFNERDMVIEIDDANIGKYRAFGLPVKFSKTPGSVRKTSPLLGEDTKAILESIGYSDSEINEFIKEEIVTVPENN